MVPTDPDDLINLGLVSSEASPEASALSADTARGVRAALAGLRAEQRRALVLAYFYGMTAAEIERGRVDPARHGQDACPGGPEAAERVDDERREPSVSEDEMGPLLGCERYAGELAELALGISVGRERAEALSHLEQCQQCQAEMERLSVAADAMLEVMPGLEPPLGFEVRLAERLRAGAAVRQWSGTRWRVRRISLVLACLLAIAGLGAGLSAGWLARGGSSPAQSAFGTGPGGSVSTRSLVSAGRAVGYVTVYSGPDWDGGGGGWLFMSLSAGSWSGAAQCEVRLADGAKLMLGKFWLDDGYGAWGVALASGTGRITSASVVTPRGVLASASFASRADSSGPGSSASSRLGRSLIARRPLTRGRRLRSRPRARRRRRQLRGHRAARRPRSPRRGPRVTGLRPVRRRSRPRCRADRSAASGTTYGSGLSRTGPSSYTSLTGIFWQIARRIGPSTTARWVSGRLRRAELGRGLLRLLGGAFLLEGLPCFLGRVLLWRLVCQVELL